LNAGKGRGKEREWIVVFPFTFLLRDEEFEKKERKKRGRFLPSNFIFLTQKKKKGGRLGRIHEG